MPTGFNDIDQFLNSNNNSASGSEQKGLGLINTPIDGVVNAGDNTLKLANTGKGIIAGKPFKNAIVSNEKKVIDLGARFQNAFGFVSNKQGASLQNTGFATAMSDGSIASVLVRDGRSSYEEFTLKRNGTIIKFAYSGLIKQIDDVFAPPPLVSFKKSKRLDTTIVSTNDANGNEVSYGEVVEQYGKKPVEISIRGLLVDMVNHQYPSDKVRQLDDLFEVNGIWDVEGQVFRDKKIESIYIVSLDDAGVQGFMDTWSFTIEARSIRPAKYFLKASR